MAAFLYVNPSEARQGCCSKHQGVCGCGCCDGTPLSDTCRPYYPECNGGGNVVIPTSSVSTNNPSINQNIPVQPTTQIYYPTWTPYPTLIPLPTNTPIPTITLNPAITPEASLTQDISPTQELPTPTATLQVTTSLESDSQTTGGGIGNFFSGIIHGLFNLLTLNIFNQPSQPTPSPISSPTTIPTLIPSITPTITITIGLQTKTTNCKAENGLQDKACTPGGVIKEATKEQICTPGYSKSVRNVSESEKSQVYAEYGITTHKTGEYEVDHLVSLELGGSNDISNLWPEAANPTPGFHEKDKVENYLHEEICKGTISLYEAQQEISTNWEQVYSFIQNK